MSRQLYGGSQTIADQQESLDVIYLRAQIRRREREAAEIRRVTRWLDWLSLGIVAFAAAVIAAVLIASHYHIGGL